jgi:hypothetical protein
MRTIKTVSRYFSLVLVLALGAGSREAAYAQGQQIRWLRVGSLHSWFSNRGAEIETGRTGQLIDQQDGLRWPADFVYQDCEVAKALWIGTTDFFDTRANREFQHKVVVAGPRNTNLDPVAEIMPVSFRMIGRFKAPTVLVDDARATDNELNDVVDVVDPALKPDRMIVNVANTAIGITMTRKMMAFAQPNHDNYFIYEYVFKNTGIIDVSGTTVAKTLTGVIFYFQYRYAAAREAFLDANPWAPTNNITWGRNTMNHVVGQNPTAPGFEFRALYSWFGRHSQWPVDSWGAPNPRDGRLGAVQYMGVVTLHADRSATDKADDPLQPKTTQYIGSDDNPLAPQGSNQFDANLMTRKYEAMSAGHPARTHAEEVGDGFADLFGNNPGGYSQGQGFGPYTLNPGDSIRIVMAEGIAGLSRQKALEVGKNWVSNNSPFTLPNGSSATDRDEYKRQWVQTGEDSLYQTFRRAMANFGINGDYDIPLAPPPPTVFEVRSGGDRITLNWTDNAVSWPNFGGYRLYRGVAKRDTFYQKIFECGRSNVVHQFIDTTPETQVDYYYYIQTIDDGSTNDAYPGVPLASSKFYAMTNRPARLLGKAVNPDSVALEETIRVVPNPFDTRTPQLGIPGAPNAIGFFGLPPQCTIKIYTERGELVETIEHTNGSGTEQWNSLTSSEQVVVSGIYIALIQTPGQKPVIRKFIIIR